MTKIYQFVGQQCDRLLDNWSKKHHRKPASTTFDGKAITWAGVFTFVALVPLPFAHTIREWPSSFNALFCATLFAITIKAFMVVYNSLILSKKE